MAVATGVAVGVAVTLTAAPVVATAAFILSLLRGDAIGATLSKIDFFASFDFYVVSATELSMNKIATTVVILLRIFPLCELEKMA